MKESKFIEQNKENWLEFENDLRYKQNKATRLSKLFIQVTDDLSYARTFYKFRSVKVYLNGIAQALFNDLYRNRTNSFKGLVTFWKYDLPMQVHSSRKEFRISLVIFVLSFFIGVFSSMYDKDFATTILGERYVNMTVENIKNHDPLAVYKSGNQADSFMWISINNLTVSLITFLLGLFFTVGTFFNLIFNGVMVGVFQYFFIERGLFKESFLTIWQHGTLEISCIIIAGAAGITLGKGLIFPGTYSRTESLKLSALRGVKIFFGITPIIILAAFIEGFFTRYTNLSDVIRIMVILVSLSFIIFYFVWYPNYLGKKQKETQKKTEKLSYTEPWKYDFSKILSSSDIMGYSIKFLFQNKFWMFWTVVILAGFHAVLAVVNQLYLNNYEFIVTVHSLKSFFQSDGIYWQFIAGLGTLSIIQIISIRRIVKMAGLILTDQGKRKSGRVIKTGISAIFSSFLILIMFYGGAFPLILSLALVAPFLFFVVAQSYIQNIFFIAAIPRTIALMNRSWGKYYWNSLKMFAFLFLLYILTSSQLTWNIMQGIYANFNFEPGVMSLVDIFLSSVVTVALFVIYFTVQVSASLFSSYAFNETVNAVSLRQKIKLFGERNIMFGFEKEDLA